MHVYIYDDFVNEKKYDSIRNQIETRITDLGLSGKIIRLGVMKDTFGAVEQEIKRGAKTIIAVGDNKIVNQALNSILYSERNNANLNIPLGIIPIGEKNNDIAHALGIKSENEACNIISARRIEKLDVGLLSSDENKFGNLKEKYFLSSIKIPSKDTAIEIDKDFSIETKGEGVFNIINLPTNNEDFTISSSNPQDGVLELLVSTPMGKKLFKSPTLQAESVLPFKNIIINSSRDILINKEFKMPAPLNLKVLKNKINLIVGKDRQF